VGGIQFQKIIAPRFFMPKKAKESELSPLFWGMKKSAGGGFDLLGLWEL